MRWLIVLALLASCGKSEEQRAREKANDLADTAREELRALRDKLRPLEEEANKLEKRATELDAQLQAALDELAKTADAQVRARLEKKLEDFKIEREDIERKVDELRAKLTGGK